MGCALAASDAAPVRAARDLALDVHGSSPATLLGTTDTTTPDMAAFVNGTMVRYLDFNDSYNGKDIAHPSDNIPRRAGGRGGAWKVGPRADSGYRTRLRGAGRLGG